MPFGDNREVDGGGVSTSGAAPAVTEKVRGCGAWVLKCAATQLQYQSLNGASWLEWRS
jgi:hypothetical protein